MCAETLYIGEVGIRLQDLLDAWVTSKHLLTEKRLNGVIVTTPRDFFEGFLPRSLDAVGACLPEDVVVAFHIAGDDGGHWQLQRNEEGSSLGPADDLRKDCEVWCDSDVFMRMVHGSLRSSRAFLSGQLRVSGDIGLALALEGVLTEAA